MTTLSETKGDTCATKGCKFYKEGTVCYVSHPTTLMCALYRSPDEGIPVAEALADTIAELVTLTSLKGGWPLGFSTAALRKHLGRLNTQIAEQARENPCQGIIAGCRASPALWRAPPAFAQVSEKLSHVHTGLTVAKLTFSLDVLRTVGAHKAASWTNDFLWA
jgi:hypothetical protein